MHQPFLYLLAFVNFVSLLHLGLYIVGANSYDIMQFRKSAKKQPIKRRKLPLVSVIIPAHNEATVIKRTLDSVRRSTYPKFEIIIVDDGSTDKTADIVRDYLRAQRWYYPNAYRARYERLSLRRRRVLKAQVGQKRFTIVTQANQGKAAAMNNAIRHDARGELIMCLDADSILHPETIERAVSYFTADPKIIGVAANVRVMGTKQWLGMLQRFEHMIGYRSKKFYSLTNSEFIIGGVASTYRTDIVKQVGMYDTDTLTEDIGLSLKLIAAHGNLEKRIIYASDVIAMTEGVQTYGALMRQRYRWKMGSLQNLFKYRHLIAHDDSHKYSRALTGYRLPMAVLSEILLVLEPLVFGYIVYLSIVFRTPAILIAAYLTVTLYVLWVVWPDEHLSLRQKLEMSFLSLVMYALFYAMDVVQISAIFRCLKDFKQISRRGESTWISPARSGEAVSF